MTVRDGVAAGLARLSSAIVALHAQVQGLGGGGSLNSLSDVDLTGANDTDYLRLESGVWVSSKRRTPPKLPLPTNYYGIPGLVVPVSRGTIALTLNRLIYSPFFCHETTEVTSARAAVTAVSASGVVRLGVCEWQDDIGQGGDMVVDFGTFTGAATGTKDLNSTFTLQGGNWYAFMTLCTGAATTVARINASTAGDARCTLSGTNWNLIDYRYKNSQDAQAVGFSASQAGTLLTLSSSTAGVTFPFLMRYT